MFDGARSAFPAVDDSERRARADRLVQEHLAGTMSLACGDSFEVR
jgi:hypothetical protein